MAISHTQKKKKSFSLKCDNYYIPRIRVPRSTEFSDENLLLYRKFSINLCQKIFWRKKKKHFWNKSNIFDLMNRFNLKIKKKTMPGRKDEACVTITNQLYKWENCHGRIYCQNYYYYA